VTAPPRPALLAGLTLAVWLATHAGAVAAQDGPTQPVNALRTALNAYDLDKSTDLFADDAVVIQPRIGGLPQIYLGQEQIRWWLRNLADQHAHWTAAQPARLVSNQDIQWSDDLSVDAFRQLQLESLEVKSEAVLAGDGRIEALTTVLTPAAARSIQLAPAGALQPDDAGSGMAASVAGSVASAPVLDSTAATSAATLAAAAVLLTIGFAGGALTMQVVKRRHQQVLSQGDSA
jgi:hypothetical protein